MTKKKSDAGKGDWRRPAKEPGLYEENFDKIDWGVNWRDVAEPMSEEAITLIKETRRELSARRTN